MSRVNRYPTKQPSERKRYEPKKPFKPYAKCKSTECDNTTWRDHATGKDNLYCNDCKKRNSNTVVPCHIIGCSNSAKPNFKKPDAPVYCKECAEATCCDCGEEFRIHPVDQEYVIPLVDAHGNGIIPCRDCLYAHCEVCGTDVDLPSYRAFASLASTLWNENFVCKACQKCKCASCKKVINLKPHIAVRYAKKIQAGEFQCWDCGKKDTPKKTPEKSSEEPSEKTPEKPSDNLSDKLADHQDVKK